jgi:hypothetical protein
LYFLQQWRIYVFIIFRESFTENCKYKPYHIISSRNSCRSTGVQPQKIHHNFMQHVKKFFSWITKIQDWLTSTAFSDNYQFTYSFVFNQTVKRRRTKYNLIISKHLSYNKYNQLYIGCIFSTFRTNNSLKALNISS